MPQVETAPSIGLPSSRTEAAGWVDVTGYQWCSLPVKAAFGTGPVHACHLEGDFDLEKLAETLADHLVRSSSQLAAPDAPGESGFRELTLRLGDALFVNATASCLTVFADKPEDARRTIEKLSHTFINPPGKRRAEFHIIKQSSGDIESESVALDATKRVWPQRELALAYGEDFPAWHGAFLDSLRTRGSGLSILDGAPGTGKTSYIRSLMVELRETHRFYFIGSACLRILRDPDFVDFWSIQRRCHSSMRLVAVIEDAESALLQRESDNRQEVSLLLNITDGILGEFLSLQVICTTNAPLIELDRALLRPGRLMARRHFAPIPRTQAAQFAKLHGKHLAFDSETYTLAEIFAGIPDPGRSTHRTLGFGAE